MKRLLADLFDFIFPPICAGCRTKLVRGEALICTTCFASFPETDLHVCPEDNAVTQRLAGTTTVVHGYALYKLQKKSRLEQALFAMKYKNQPKIGELLGSYYGSILANHATIHCIDAIVPVPLHPRRLYERGYNQSACFAAGLAASLQLPLYADCLKRIRNTPTQTKKNKEERVANVAGAFAVERPDDLAQRRLLVVDDILTTGATLAACTQTLWEHGAGAVSVAALALVED